LAIWSSISSGVAEFHLVKDVRLGLKCTRMHPGMFNGVDWTTIWRKSDPQSRSPSLAPQSHNAI
jgi:hypothetical protein